MGVCEIVRAILEEVRAVAISHGFPAVVNESQGGDYLTEDLMCKFYLFAHISRGFLNIDVSVVSIERFELVDKPPMERRFELADPGFMERVVGFFEEARGRFHGGN